jgi:hypothetical protein
MIISGPPHIAQYHIVCIVDHTETSAQAVAQHSHLESDIASSLTSKPGLKCD